MPSPARENSPVKLVSSPLQAALDSGPSSTLPARTRGYVEAAGLLVVMLAAAVTCSFRITLDETFMRLALGRFAMTGASSSARDPWLFTIPDFPFHDPEWLGDVLLHFVYRVGGEVGLVTLKVTVVAVGFGLLYLLGRRRGGAVPVLVALALAVLAGSAERLTERNEIHMLWLVPAYGLVLLRGRERPRALLALLPLGLVWVNLHGSFLLGWVLIGAATADALLGVHRDGKRVVTLVGLMAAHLLLPLATHDGVHTYTLPLSLLKHSELIRNSVYEFLPPDRLPATLNRLPLHLLGVLGLLSFLPRPNRRNVEGFLLIAFGLLGAHGSDRLFLPFGLMALPVIAENLHRAAAALPRLPHRRWRIAGAVALVASATALWVPPARAEHQWPAARDGQFAPVRAARWMGGHAAPGTRLFHAYSGSQWLMWEAPQLSLYVVAYGSVDEALLRSFRETLESPARFDAEVAARGVTMAQISWADETRLLFGHLASSPSWRLVFWDGTFGVYARDVPENRELIARFGYRTLRSWTGFEYLAGADEVSLQPELARLGEDAPAVRDAIVGYRLLAAVAADGSGDRVRLTRARDLLRAAAGSLRQVPAVPAYLVQVHLALGERTEARAVLAGALAQYPGSERLRALIPAVAPGRT